MNIMEDKSQTSADQAVVQELLQQEQQQPQLQSIVTSNGVRIISKLNPAAKEFYPSHITRRNQVFHEIIKETKSAEKFLEIINDDCKETPMVPGRIEIIEQEVCIQTPQIPEEVSKIEIVVDENSAGQVVCGGDEVLVQEESKCLDTVDTVVVSEPTVQIVDDKVCGDCITVSECEVVEEKKPLEIQTLFKTSDVITEGTEEEKVPLSLVINSTSTDEVKALIKEIEDEINAEKSNEEQKPEIESTNTETLPETEKATEEQENNEVHEKTVTEEKSEQKKVASVKKHSTLKRVSKIALSSLKKASSSHSNNTTSSNTNSQASGDKSTTQKTTTSHTSSTMSRTKRISESLHNLSTTLKAKTSENKNTDIQTAKVPSRGITTIPRSAVRARVPLIKATDVNGLKKDVAAKNLAKDAISLRSTSSTEKSVTSKSSLSASIQSAVSSKKLHGKLSNTSSLSSEGKSITATTTTTTTTAAAAASLQSTQNSKDSTQKLPRGTVASSLRQTEAQKRRNLFPIDDLEANIELSHFLFK